MDGCLVISVSSCASIVMSVCNHAYNKIKIKNTDGTNSTIWCE